MAKMHRSFEQKKGNVYETGSRLVYNVSTTEGDYKIDKHNHDKAMKRRIKSGYKKRK